MTALMLDAPPVFALEIASADVNTPYRARHWLGWLLEAAHVPQTTIDAALLVASELATNAVVHAGGRVLVSAQITAGGVRLIVHDDQPVTEWQEPGGDLDERGRGLILVDALAEKLHIATHAHGTTVTAVIPSAEAAG